jgi:hypothetical protein
MTITNEQIDDILASAFEGGINYWAGKAEPEGDFPAGAEFASEAVSRGGTVILHHDDPKTGDDGDFTARSKLVAANVRDGIRKAAKQMGQSTEAFLEDYDASGADIAVQFAIFGEVVYG